MTPELYEYEHNDFAVIQIFFIEMILESIKKGRLCACQNERLFDLLEALSIEVDGCVSRYVEHMCKIAMAGMSPSNFEYLLEAEYMSYSDNLNVYNRKVMLFCKKLLCYFYRYDIDCFIDVLEQLSPLSAQIYALEHFYPELTEEFFAFFQLNPSDSTLKKLEYYRQRREEW